MHEAIERVIKELELKRRVCMVTKAEDKAVAYENAIELLREELKHEGVD